MTKMKITAEKLHDLYYEQKLSMEKIGEMYGCARGAVWRRMKLMHIPRRDLSESHLGQKAWNKGKKYHVGILGGHSRHVSCRIGKELLPRNCFSCGSTENLVAHHKDGDSRNNHIPNIEVLCRSCHAKVHNMARFLPKDGGWSKRRN